MYPAVYPRCVPRSTTHTALCPCLSGCGRWLSGNWRVTVGLLPYIVAFDQTHRRPPINEDSAMKCNVITLKAARGRRALTQEMLAAQARIDVRTVQRAEAGEPLRQETIADLAAVLGVPSSALVVLDGSEEHANGDAPTLGQVWGAGQILKQVRSGRDVIATLEESELVKLECDVDPTEANFEALKDAVEFTESLIVDPWTWDDPPCLTFSRLVHRLEAIANMNGHLTALEGQGLAMFSGSTIERAVMPRCNAEGEVYVRDGQQPISVRATRLVIAEYASERVTVQKATKWPVEIEAAPALDPDDDVPF